MDIFDITKQIFITKLDNIYFRIMNKTISTRLIVNIHSSNSYDNLLDPNNQDINKFSVYLSRSDLGCFRLCLRWYDNPNNKHNNNIYYKAEYGNDSDYIQQTFIHLQLQKFIYECLEHLKNLDYNRFIQNSYCDVHNDHNDDDNEILKHIDNKNRKIKEKPFYDHHNEFKCGYEITYNYDIIIEKLNNFSKLLESLYECKNNQLIFEHQVDNNLDQYKIQFYKINLNLKIKHNKYIDNIILYYCNVYIIKFNSTSFDKEEFFNLPIFLTVDDKITKFGTFNTYILTGNYICKLFEYRNQCPDKTKMCFKKDKDTENKGYVLIGDRYDNIFPLNIIKKDILIKNRTDDIIKSQININIHKLKKHLNEHFNKLKVLNH